MFDGLARKTRFTGVGDGCCDRVAPTLSATRSPARRLRHGAARSDVVVEGCGPA